MIKNTLVTIVMMIILNTCVAVGIKADTVEGIRIDTVNFPDDVFRKTASYYDTDNNGYLSDDEIKKITSIYYDGGDNSFHRRVTSLKGIEYFRCLETLHLMETQVTSIDLSQNKNLAKVSILNPNTKELVFPQNGKITELSLINYESKLLDLSMLTELNKIELNGCVNLETMDLSMNHKLKSVALNAGTDSKGKRKNNRLKTITIGDNENLRYLSCDNLLNLETINIDKTPVLKSIYVKNNKKLKFINTINMPELSKLNVEGCGLKALNVSKNLKFQFLNCDNNKLKKLSVTQNKALKQLYCSKNKLSKLNIRNNVNLKTLKCDSNKIKALNLSKNKKLSKLTCKKNKIKKLDIRKTKLKIKKIKCDNKVIISK